MIYRAWPRLDELARREGRHETVVRNAFLGEFERLILSGDRDADWRSSREGALKPSAAAKELQESFVDIPAGRFRMGAPDDRQGMGTEQRNNWQAFIERFRREHSLEAFLEDRLRPYKERSRTDAQLIQYLRQQFTRAFNEGVQVLENWWFPHDETPETDSSELKIDAFQLSRYPVLNRWYRLFDPGHGTTGSPYDDYAAISGTEDRPLIYADWYMSWCFALFCHWDGHSCELPGEDQWEYAAKAERTVVNWPGEYSDFWWGDDFEQGRHHCTFHAKRTTPPADFTKAKTGKKHHENPFGLVDMLGNVLEWTRDRYRRRYSRTETEGKSSAFVLRGGSWGNGDATDLRCARRGSNQPTYTDYGAGCRLSRVARARKP
ncbi:MAG UNVERIFIED_CONTAM: SUMF1/EgtB/PvdO family nonheme iron enzyme [Planctomycetaceae bacterium]|jgi:formylglycine-generating enzyme required for sulfatase activity